MGHFLARAIILMAVWAVVALGFDVQPLGAQSIVQGAIIGVVRDDDGLTLEGVSIVAVGSDTGVSTALESDREGTYEVPLLPAGNYELIFEARGFIPRLVRNVRIRPGQTLRVSVELQPAPPPVETIDTVFLGAATLPRVDAQSNRWVSRSEIASFPDPRMGLGTLATLSSLLGPGLGADGLPGSASTIYMDGIPFTSVRHPLQTGADDLPFLPRLGLASLDVHRRTDVEWSGSTGAYVAGNSRPAQAGRAVELAGSGTAAALWSSDAFSGVAVPDMGSGWGGAAAHLAPEGGPSFFIGVEGISSRTPHLSPLSGDLASRLIAASPPSQGTTPEDLSDPWLNELRAVTGLARTDWSGENTRGMARVSLATFREGGGDFFGRPLIPGTTAPFDGTDFTGAVSVTTEVHPIASIELKAGVEHSTRDWSGPSGGSEISLVPSTRFTTEPAVLGGEAGLLGHATRTGFLASALVHLRWTGQRVKVGVSGSVPSYEYEYLFGSGGEFLFGAPEQIATGHGLFAETIGAVSRTSFTVPEIGLFAQHTWEISSGVQLVTGARLDYEVLPESDIRRNDRWAGLTGVANASVRTGLTKFAPRVSLSWEPGIDGSTIVEGSVSADYGRLDPAALHEVLSLRGETGRHRQLGGLGSWPDPPTTPGDARSTGTLLALFGPRLEAPRTARATLGVSRRLAENTVFQVSASLRRTEYLLRRSDLNLAQVPIGETAEGRALYGSLRQLGSLVVATPGSNRRFSEFDAVWALTADGASERTSISASIEHGVTDRFDIFAGYTFSSTEDNLVGRRLGIPEATLSPNLDPDGEDDWARGTSDFDVPHRLAAGVQASLPVLEGLEVSAVYRMSSGTPFTAGYRVGVDVNGDGSGYNDPAQVPTSLAGVSSGEIRCLDNDLGSIAMRNGCRGPNSHALDLHVSLGLVRLGSSIGALTLDVFNLLDTEAGLPDAALLLVAENGELPPGPTASVPVRVNPDFGNTLPGLRPGRLLRLGFEVTLP